MIKFHLYNFSEWKLYTILDFVGGFFPIQSDI